MSSPYRPSPFANHPTVVMPDKKSERPEADQPRRSRHRALCPVLGPRAVDCLRRVDVDAVTVDESSQWQFDTAERFSLNPLTASTTRRESARR